MSCVRPLPDMTGLIKCRSMSRLILAVCVVISVPRCCGDSYVTATATAVNVGSAAENGVLKDLAEPPAESISDDVETGELTSLVHLVPRDIPKNASQNVTVKADKAPPQNTSNRNLVNVSLEGVEWHYLDNNAAWQSFDAEHTGILEVSYQQNSSTAEFVIGEDRHVVRAPATATQRTMQNMRHGLHS